MPGAALARVLTAPTSGGVRLAAERLLLGVLPVVVFVAFCALSFSDERSWGFDFRPLWEAARDLAQGRSPYPPAEASALRDEQQFVYPPLAALVALPFAPLPFQAATTLFALVLVAAGALTLRLLGVRDWRCYGVALLWLPVIRATLLGTVSILLALGVAVAWRYRSHAWAAPLAVAAVVAGKLFLWPLLVWLAATRRGASAFKALAVAVGGVLASWAVIGFAGLTDYPRLLDELAQLLEWKSYSAVALGLASGLTQLEARMVSLAVGAAVLAAAVVRGRARDGDADRQAFVLAIAAAFLLTPIVWVHYVAILAVPVAIARPRLAPVWFLPLLIWAVPNQSDGRLGYVALGLATWALVLALSLRAPRPAANSVLGAVTPPARAGS